MKFNIKTQKHNKLGLAVFIFGLVFFIFNMGVKNWYFVGEDYCLTYRVAKVGSASDILNIFRKGDVQYLFHYNLGSQNCVEREKTFANVYYRPLAIFTHFIEYKIFGLDSYNFYLFIIFLHALISALLFLIFSLFVSNLWAMSAALFFAFNSILFDWIGKIDTQQSQLCLFFMLLAFLVAKKIIENDIGKTSENLLTVLSGTFFLLSVLARETPLVMPFIFLMFLIFYRRNPHTWKIVKLFLCFTFFAFVYVWMRQLEYPLSFGLFTAKHSQHLSIFTVISQFYIFVFDWIKQFYYRIITIFIFHKFYFFCEAGGFVWVYKIIKNLLFVLLLSLFIFSNKKKLIIFLIISFALMLWPPTFFDIGGASRFYYEALPFAALAVAVLMNSSSLVKNIKVKALLIVLFAAYLLGLMFFTVRYQNQASKKWQHVPAAINAALKQRQGTGAQLGCIWITNLGDAFFHKFGILEAMELYGISGPKFLLRFIEIHPKSADISEFLRVEYGENNVCFRTLNKDVLYFDLNKFYVEDKNVFDYIFNVSFEYKDETIVGVNFKFKEKIKKEEMRFLFWNEVKRDFFLTGQVELGM